MYKPIDHLFKAYKPRSKAEFGYFLAGLIDSDGHIEKKGYIQISFSHRDLSVARYIQKIIGYGSIRKETKTRCYVYRCYHRRYVYKIGRLVHNKLKHKDKIKQYNERLCPKLSCSETIYVEESLIQNHWLVGFVMGDGCFKIELRKMGHRRFLRLVVRLSVTQKTNDLLILIKGCFGGSLSHYKTRNTWYYQSSNIATIFKIIDYFDRFQLMGSTLRIYKLWREAFNLQQSGDHLTTVGQEKLKSIKHKIKCIRANERPYPGNATILKNYDASFK